MDRALIDAYSEGPQTLRQALQGLSTSHFQAKPGPGDWSIQELVIHVVDSDLVGADRMKRVIAEENPPLLAFDENKWTARLFYEERSLADAVELFDFNRRQMTQILRRLSDADFARVGVHNERGPHTLAQLVATFVNHLEHHLTFLREKRARLGK